MSVKTSLNLRSMRDPNQEVNLIRKVEAAVDRKVKAMEVLKVDLSAEVEAKVEAEAEVVVPAIVLEVNLMMIKVVAIVKAILIHQLQMLQLLGKKRLKRKRKISEWF